MFKQLLTLTLVINIIFLNFSFLSPYVATAASLTAISDTVSNLTVSAAASHTIRFTTPTGILNNKTVILTFDNGTSTTGVTFSDVTVQDDGSSITVNNGAPSGSNWGFSNSSPAITFTTGSGTIAAGSIMTITFNGTNKITNSSTPASTTTLRISGNFGDTGVVSMAIIANGVVSVTAEVPSSISFTVSNNNIYFGNLRTAANCFAQNTDPGFVSCPTTTEAEAFNMTASTNATTGYTITVQGDTLKSGATNSISALAVATAPSFGNEQFGLSIQATGGSGTSTAPYSTAGQFAYTGTTGTAASVAGSTVASLTTTYSVRYLANISPITEAGSYTTAHTYVATGNF